MRSGFFVGRETRKVWGKKLKNEIILNGWPAGLSELPIELLVVVVISAGFASIFFLRHPRTLRAASHAGMTVATTDPVTLRAAP